MFSIYDGRKHFYQWDIDRKLFIEDTSITQVHFTNRTHTTALVCEVVDNLVNVPNILLQEDWDIAVYAYDKNYTRYDDSFEVKKRNKPDNYVYTETEVLNYNTLLDRVNAVDGNIESTIEKYLKENPPEVDFTGYATEEYVDNAVANVKVDLTGYATEDYVDDAISAIPKTDLSNYYTMAQTDNKFALKSEIPSTSGFATEEYVDNAVANLDIPEVDLSNYATTEEVEKLERDILDNHDAIDVLTEQVLKIDLSNYYTKEETTTAINEALGVIENGTY